MKPAPPHRNEGFGLSGSPGGHHDSDRLSEPSHQAVRMVMHNAQTWEDVNKVIDALREQAEARFGKDYSDPSFDV